MSDPVWPHRQQPPRLPRPWASLGKNTWVGCHFLLQCMTVKSESEVAQSCPTLHNPMDCSLPGSSIHGISQARVLGWVAIAFSLNQPTITFLRAQVQAQRSQATFKIIQINIIQNKMKENYCRELNLQNIGLAWLICFLWSVHSYDNIILASIVVKTK